VENARRGEINRWRVLGSDVVGGFIGGCKGYIRSICHLSNYAIIIFTRGSI